MGLFCFLTFVIIWGSLPWSPLTFSSLSYLCVHLPTLNPPVAMPPCPDLAATGEIEPRRRGSGAGLLTSSALDVPSSPALGMGCWHIHGVSGTTVQESPTVGGDAVPRIPVPWGPRGGHPRPPSS